MKNIKIAKSGVPKTKGIYSNSKKNKNIPELESLRTFTLKKI
jgi:hypothetical protein